MRDQIEAMAEECGRTDDGEGYTACMRAMVAGPGSLEWHIACAMILACSEPDSDLVDMGSHAL